MGKENFEQEKEKNLKKDSSFSDYKKELESIRGDLKNKELTQDTKDSLQGRIDEQIIRLQKTIENQSFSREAESKMNLLMIELKSLKTKLEEETQTNTVEALAGLEEEQVTLDTTKGLEILKSKPIDLKLKELEKKNTQSEMKQVEDDMKAYAAKHPDRPNEEIAQSVENIGNIIHGEPNRNMVARWAQNIMKRILG